MTSPSNKFDSGTRVGVSLSVVASMLSAISVLAVLCYTMIKRVKKFRARRAAAKRQENIKLPRGDVTDSLGFSNLMAAELVQAISGLLNIRWVTRDFIAEGAYCTGQGRIKQIGDVGVALYSLVIAFDTFFVLCFGWRAQKRIRSWAIIGTALFIIMLVAVGSGVNGGSNPPYYGNTRFWCWIRPEYKTERIALQYIWMWVALFATLILYGIMALVKYGYVEGRRNRLRNEDDRRTTRGLGTGSDNDEANDKIMARAMLYYPAVYIFCVLPLSIVRWVDLNDDNISAAATIVTSVIFSLSGVFNVLVFGLTRPALISGDIDNIDPPSQHELRTSLSGHSGLPTGAGDTTHKPTGLDSGIPRPAVAPEASPTRHAGSQAASSFDASPRTQESLWPPSRDSALPPRTV